MNIQAEPDTWQLQEAKSKFSRLVDSAIDHSPQIVTKRGKKAVVIMAYDEYLSFIQPKNKLSEFFRQSPLHGEEFSFERNKDHPRGSEF